MKGLLLFKGLLLVVKVMMFDIIFVKGVFVLLLLKFILLFVLVIKLVVDWNFFKGLLGF